MRAGEWTALLTAIAGVLAALAAIPAVGDEPASCCAAAGAISAVADAVLSRGACDQRSRSRPPVLPVIVDSGRGVGGSGSGPDLQPAGRHWASGGRERASQDSGLALTAAVGASTTPGAVGATGSVGFSRSSGGRQVRRAPKCQAHAAGTCPVRPRTRRCLRLGQSSRVLPAPPQRATAPDDNAGPTLGGAARRLPGQAGGGCGIRTREGVNPTRFPSVRHRPLGESSASELSLLAAAAGHRSML